MGFSPPSFSCSNLTSVSIFFAQVSPNLTGDLLDLLVKDCAARPVLIGDIAEIPEGENVTLGALGMIYSFLVLDRVFGKTEPGPPIERRGKI